MCARGALPDPKGQRLRKRAETVSSGAGARHALHAVYGAARTCELLGKVVSITIGLAYVAGAFAGLGAWPALGTLGLLLVPLACIWFPEDVGEWTGSIGFHRVSLGSPSVLVTLMGWFLLLLPVLLGVIAILMDDA